MPLRTRSTLHCVTDACLLEAQRVSDRTQVDLVDLGAAADPLLKAEERLDDHQVGQPAQADIAALGDG